MNALTPVPRNQPTEPYEGAIEDAAKAGQARAATVGSEFKHQALDWVRAAGARIERGHHKVGSYHVEAVICGGNGQKFVLLAHGVLDDGNRPGLQRTDTIKKVGFDASAIRRLRKLPILLVTSHLPESGTAVSQLADCAEFIFDTFATNGDLAGFQRLRRYLHEQPFPGRLPAPWRDNPSQYETEMFDGADQPLQPEPSHDSKDEVTPQ